MHHCYIFLVSRKATSTSCSTFRSTWIIERLSKTWELHCVLAWLFVSVACFLIDRSSIPCHIFSDVIYILLLNLTNASEVCIPSTCNSMIVLLVFCSYQYEARYISKIFRIGRKWMKFGIEYSISNHTALVRSAIRTVRRFTEQL